MPVHALFLARRLGRPDNRVMGAASFCTIPLSALVLPAALCFIVPAGLRAQGETTSAITGQVTDASSSAISGATVTIVSTDNGLKRTVKTDGAGRFSFPQLRPGNYTVKAEAEGFEPQQIDSLASGLGQKQTANFTLTVAATKQSVLVTAEAPLINTANANTSTSMTAKALENLPNPGGDMTYPLQFSAGALVNTAGSSNDFVGSSNGYGNVGFNGLPAVSNGYIVDGLETNDPLTNLNSGLSTNLVSGNEFHRGGHRQHRFLCGRPGSIWRFAGQLRNEIRRQSIPWESL